MLSVGHENTHAKLCCNVLFVCECQIFLYLPSNHFFGNMLKCIFLHPNTYIYMTYIYLQCLIVFNHKDSTIPWCYSISVSSYSLSVGSLRICSIKKEAVFNWMQCYYRKRSSFLLCIRITLCGQRCTCLRMTNSYPEEIIEVYISSEQPLTAASCR